ncbi:MAG TPA: serine hydrolase domain-containing protein [Thermoanaerobaculia bacterium]|nr:serine hydrolase domain-containing protein [Thermoanaerobaculia bacterium]
MSFLLAAALLHPAARDRLSTIVEPFLSKNSVPGIAVAVLRDGKIVAANGFGRTAPDGGEAVTAETRFRIASVTKPLTATLVLQLVAEGKLSLADRAHARCAAFAPRGGDPEIRELLSHQGGVRHSTDDEDTKITGDFPRLSAAVSRLSDEKLRFSPGTDTLYSSWGYAVLGCVIEETSGRRFSDVLAARVLEPAGMSGTVTDRPDFSGPGFSGGFRAAGGKLMPSEVVDTRFKQPASGLISTASDLAAFAAALYDGRLLPEKLRAELFTPQATRGGKPAEYSLGMMVGREKKWGQAFYHTGSMEGTTALLYLIPERRYAVVLLANRERFVREVSTLIPEINEAFLTSP